MVFMFLRPRSFLKSIDTEIKSMSVVIIENSLEHEQTEYTFNVNDPEFHEIMDVLDRYPYHISLGTISNRIKDTAHIEDNKAAAMLSFKEYICVAICTDIIPQEDLDALRKVRPVPIVVVPPSYSEAQRYACVHFGAAQYLHTYNDPTAAKTTNQNGMQHYLAIPSS